MHKYRVLGGLLRQVNFKKQTTFKLTFFFLNKKITRYKLHQKIAQKFRALWKSKRHLYTLVLSLAATTFTCWSRITLCTGFPILPPRFNKSPCKFQPFNELKSRFWTKYNKRDVRDLFLCRWGYDGHFNWHVQLPCFNWTNMIFAPGDCDTRGDNIDFYF